LVKNSQPFGKKFQKTVGGGIFLTHIVYVAAQNRSTESTLVPHVRNALYSWQTVRAL